MVAASIHLRNFYCRGNALYFLCDTPTLLYPTLREPLRGTGTHKGERVSVGFWRITPSKNSFVVLQLFPTTAVLSQARAPPDLND